jgi:nuclear cap-binding protein subunit 1
LKKRAPEDEIQPLIDIIHDRATQNGSEDPLIESTDAYMTAVCFIGAKSLSHVLSCIERCKERLLSIGTQSEAARRQIIQSVVSYWADLPGTAVNIVDKLLNYTIVTPESVVRWCLASQTTDSAAVARGLADTWRYEMLAATMGKVTNRVRQIVSARVQALRASLPDDQMAVLDGTLRTEREGMRGLFALIAELMAPFDESAMSDVGDEAAEQIRLWGVRWARVFKRKAAVEETVVGEDAVAATLIRAQAEWEREERIRVAEEAERERLRALREKAEEEERVKRRKIEEQREEDERERDRKMMNGDETGHAAPELDVAEGD